MFQAPLKKLNTLGDTYFHSWKQVAMLDSKEVGTWNMMIGKADECPLELALIAAHKTEDLMKIAKAKLAKQKAIMKTINFLWNSLHQHDKDRVSQEMEEDNLPGMWAALQPKPTIEELDMQVEIIYKLQCGNKDPLDFISECKLHQEKLYSSEAGKTMKTIEACIRHCVSRLPNTPSWSLFKIQQNIGPSKTWPALIHSVEIYIAVTGVTKSGGLPGLRDNVPPNANRAYALDGMGDAIV